MGHVNLIELSAKKWIISSILIQIVIAIVQKKNKKKAQVGPRDMKIIMIFNVRFIRGHETCAWRVLKIRAHI